ncbi:GIY-YIG nuclease family protein [Croceimicrobium hydrocarbonivorans]|uniref:GIY-YIG nuclease family protein n=1 Tax=Croceimicrobium hydrocarbonivorans TaxID=2761580 RepID=A0A7H0VI56_9FLAO|nr:GIY-YIG nuclease family protein [Croceimicrobium hydrocarbonivorans]
MKRYFVYALWSPSHSRLYIGLTSNLKIRLEQHNSGKTRSNRYYRPWKVLKVEETTDLNSARQLELKWKGGSFRERFRELAKHKFGVNGRND